MSQTFTYLLIFLGAACSAAAVAMLIFEHSLRERWNLHQRLAAHLSPQTDETRNKRSPLFRDLKALEAQTRQGQPGWRRRLEIRLEQSGLPITGQAVLVIALTSGMAAGGITWLLSGYPLLVAVVTSAAFISPFVFVEACRRSRTHRLCHQLPEAFDLMKRAMRAGQSLPNAMQVVANDMRPPLADEFSICCKQQELGLPLQTTLDDLARRTGLMEVYIFAVAMVVQRESGGNCLELFTNLAELVRKRIHLVSRVKAMTSEGRLQAIVLGLLPLVAFISIFVIDPEYARPLVERPQLLMALVASEMLGILWIRRIVNIEY
ncbi:hypothetical protein GC163_21345 [bacterium]|nr:hypothetical protein [bacterium]